MGGYGDPEPAAIAAMCKKIQASWSMRDRRLRLVGGSGNKEPLTAPQFLVHHEIRDHRRGRDRVRIWGAVG